MKTCMCVQGLGEGPCLTGHIPTTLHSRYSQHCAPVHNVHLHCIHSIAPWCTASRTLCPYHPNNRLTCDVFSCSINIHNTNSSFNHPTCSQCPRVIHCVHTWAIAQHFSGRPLIHMYMSVSWLHIHISLPSKTILKRQPIKPIIALLKRQELNKSSSCVMFISLEFAVQPTNGEAHIDMQTFTLLMLHSSTS